MIRKFFSSLFFLTFLAGTAWLIGFIWFIAQVPSPSLTKSANPKTDIGVVLTGSNGRITHGLLMLHEQKFKNLLITGVNPNIPKSKFFKTDTKSSSSKLFQLYRNRITLGRDARSTRGNALEVKKYLGAFRTPVKSITVITSNYHMPRGLHELKRELPASIKLMSEPAFTPEFPVNWWQELNPTLLLISEYHKTLISYAAQFVTEETELNEFLANNPL
jgi:uncharacterized SAM-binding protein YcdF (DUF218 family)